MNSSDILLLPARRTLINTGFVNASVLYLAATTACYADERKREYLSYTFINHVMLSWKWSRKNRDISKLLML